MVMIGYVCYNEQKMGGGIAQVDLYLMRHGETDLNKQFRMQGSVDAPINATGKQQALDAGERIRNLQLSFDEVICSPLIRAQETAELATGKSREQLIVDQRVQEIDYGPFDGKKILSLPPKVLAFLIAPHKRENPEGIESVDHLYDRVSDFLEDIALQYDNEKILVVTHGIAMRAMIGRIQGMDSRGLWKNRISINNCELFHVPVRERKFGEISRIT